MNFQIYYRYEDFLFAYQAVSIVAGHLPYNESQYFKIRPLMFKLNTGDEDFNCLLIILF